MGFHDACYDFLWECVESCCGFSDDVIFCDLEAPDEALSLMCDYRRIKRDDVPTVYYGDFKSMLSIISGDNDGWAFFIFPDEIVHEMSWHYIWDIGVHHTSSYDGAMVPILSSCEDGVDECIRIISIAAIDHLSRDGVELIQVGSLNILPAGLFPRPVWKLPARMDDSNIDEMDPPEIVINSSSKWVTS
jgi:hypothetical protein